MTPFDLQAIKAQYPPFMQEGSFDRLILREHIELLALEHIAHSSFASKLSFIGGTNLRITKHIDRFSEDLDFDCKDFSKEEFEKLSESLATYLRRYGFKVEFLPVNEERLTAFRKALLFPGLLQETGLTGHPDERFKMKLEVQDQGYVYPQESALVSNGNFMFSIRTPSEPILLSMKLAAILSRAKGRDFYDAMFLMNRTAPDFGFLREKAGIADWDMLLTSIEQKLDSTDMKLKVNDFRHLLIREENAGRILSFRTVFREWVLRSRELQAYSPTLTRQ